MLFSFLLRLRKLLILFSKSKILIIELTSIIKAVKSVLSKLELDLIKSYGV